MVAKPIVDTPGTASEETLLDGNSIPLPICLKFAPALEALAEAGYVGDRFDQWLVQFNEANRAVVGKLELNAEGELLISPMQSKAGSRLEGIVFGELYVWTRESGGEAHGARLGIHLPNGACYAPDAAWLSPEQLADYSPAQNTWLLHFCPHFVVEIMSRNDRPGAVRRKMADYVAHGARLGWLIDPFRRQVHIYRPGSAPLMLDDPEQVSGAPELPGFVLDVRALVFDAHQAGAGAGMT
jgi:Uma2 family endonuclease